MLGSEYPADSLENWKGYLTKIIPATKWVGANCD